MSNDICGCGCGREVREGARFLQGHKIRPSLEERFWKFVDKTDSPACGGAAAKDSPYE